MQNKKAILLLGLALLASSCGGVDVSDSFSNDGSNIGTSSPSIDTSVPSTESNDIPSSDLPSVDDNDKYYTLPNWPEDQYQVSVGLTDLGVKRSLVTGESYNLQFKFTGGGSFGDAVYVSSNEEVVTIAEDEEGQVIITCHHAGMAKIRIYDGNGDVRYCEVVRVADPIALEDMEEHLVENCDEWHSLMAGADEYVITFFPGGQYTISGYDQYGGSFTTLKGTYEYVETLEISGITEYKYEFTGAADENNPAALLQLVGFNVDITGEFMHLQANGATANILYPSYREEEFKQFKF